MYSEFAGYYCYIPQDVHCLHKKSCNFNPGCDPYKIKEKQDPFQLTLRGSAHMP
jgi:hypothetical protein